MLLGSDVEAAEQISSVTLYCDDNSKQDLLTSEQAELEKEHFFSIEDADNPKHSCSYLFFVMSEQSFFPLSHIFPSLKTHLYESLFKIIDSHTDLITVSSPLLL